MAADVKSSTESLMAAKRPLRTSRRLRFSLRALLVVVTGVCVALGLWVNAAERQRRTVKGIRELGGFAYYSTEWRSGKWIDDDSAPWVRLLRGFTGPDYLDEVVVVHLTFDSGSGLAFVRTLPRLKLLNVGGTEISDAGLQYISELPDLESLVLSRTYVTEEGLLRLLPQMNSLRDVNLDKYRISEQCASRLRTLMPTVTITRH
jgi:hypothetical protein